MSNSNRRKWKVRLVQQSIYEVVVSAAYVDEASKLAVEAFDAGGGELVADQPPDVLWARERKRL